MKTDSLIGLAIVFSAALSAHGYRADAAAEPQQPQAEPAAQPQTLLTGCLRSHGADTAIAGPTGRLYTLEAVETVESPTPTTSTPTGTPPAASTVTYSLSNVGKVDLEKHADHQVQLIGRMQAPSPAAQKSAAKPASGAPAREPTPGGAHRTFHVTGLKMISAKCSS